MFALVTSSVQETAEQSYSSEAIQSRAVEDERAVMVKEERPAPQETRVSPVILPVLERVADDWFVLFQVIPRKTTYVSPGTAQILCLASAHRNREHFYLNGLVPMWDCLTCEELNFLFVSCS